MKTLLVCHMHFKYIFNWLGCQKPHWPLDIETCRNKLNMTEEGRKQIYFASFFYFLILFSVWKCFSSECIVELCKEFHWLICRSDLCKNYHAAPSVQSMVAQSHSANVAWHQISSSNDRTSRLGFPSTAVSSSVSLEADSDIFCSVWRHLETFKILIPKNPH